MMSPGQDETRVCGYICMLYIYVYILYICIYIIHMYVYLYFIYMHVVMLHTCIYAFSYIYVYLLIYNIRLAKFLVNSSFAYYFLSHIKFYNNFV